MEQYNYRTHIIEDIEQYVKDNNWFEEHQELSEEDMIQELTDELWDIDEVTGNGPYFYDTEDKCAEYLCHNLNLVYEVIREMYDSNILTRSLAREYENHSIARYLDVCIRCYLLYECVWRVVNDSRTIN